MRTGFDRTFTSLKSSLGNGGRRSETFFTRTSYSLVMSHHMLRAPVTDNRRRQSAFLGFTCCRAGFGQRQRRRRSSTSTLCCYITAVVLLQNVLMAYSIMQRASLVLASETIANYSVNQSSAATANSHIPVSNPAALTRTSTTSTKVSIKTSSSPASTLREELSFETDLKTERMYYRKRPTKVNPYKHQFLLIPTKLCDASTVMVILVHSGTRNGALRSAIRETWGDAAKTGHWPNEQEKNGSCAGLRLAFVLGLQEDEAVNRAVREEHARHDDIVQGDFVDHYHNMTLKSLLDLKVVDERCPGVRYLLKTDDDMIVNLPYLLLLLINKQLQRSIMGPVIVGARAHRSGKWKLTTEEFPFVLFPPYEAGSAYVITGDLIHELFVTAEYVPHIFVDDVYVTGILGRILGVNHVMHRGFAFWHTRPPSVCDIVLNRVITGTKMTPTILRNIWKQLHNPTCPIWA